MMNSSGKIALIMSLRERIIKYYSIRPTTWTSSGEIQRIVAINTKYTPRTAVRRLQELCEEGILEVQLRNGHSWYRIKNPPENTPKPTSIFIPGVGEMRV